MSIFFVWHNFFMSGNLVDQHYTVDALMSRIFNYRKPSGKLRKVCLSNLIADITTARFPLGNQLKVSNKKTMCISLLEIY